MDNPNPKPNQNQNQTWNLRFWGTNWLIPFLLSAPSGTLWTLSRALYIPLLSQTLSLQWNVHWCHSNECSKLGSPLIDVTDHDHHCSISSALLIPLEPLYNHLNPYNSAKWSGVTLSGSTHVGSHQLGHLKLVQPKWALIALWKG